MKKIIVKQFTEADSVEVEGINHPSCGKLVHIIQRAGSMTFQFSMTPDQARTLGDALFQHADALEPSHAE